MFTLLLGSVLLQPAPEPPADAVKGLPPLIVKAKVNRDQLVSPVTVTTMSHRIETRQRVVGGKAVTETVTVKVPVETMVYRAWDLNKAKITNGSGKKIDLETLRKRLAVDTPVVISADGKPISRGYLNLMRAEVIIIEAPLVESVVPPPPPPK